MLRCSRRPRAHWGDCNSSSESDSTPYYRTEFLKEKQCCVLTQYHRYYWFVWLIKGLFCWVVYLNYIILHVSNKIQTIEILTGGFHIQERVREQDRKSVNVSQSTATWIKHKSLDRFSFQWLFNTENSHDPTFPMYFYLFVLNGLNYI